MEPEVLILDEPTAGLDPRGRDEILDQISKLHTERKMTIILVSHSMEDVARYVDRIIVVNDGKILFDDTPKQVFQHYKRAGKRRTRSTSGHLCGKGSERERLGY